MSLAEGNQLVEITNFNIFGDLEADITGWNLCNQTTCVQFPDGILLPPDGILQVHVAAEGTNDASGDRALP